MRSKGDIWQWLRSFTLRKNPPVVMMNAAFAPVFPRNPLHAFVAFIVRMQECMNLHAEHEMGKEIKIIKGSKPATEGYTFTDNGTGNLLNANEPKAAPDSEGKRQKDDVSKLRSSPKDMKARGRSRLTGGHSKQGHSPVYE